MNNEDELRRALALFDLSVPFTAEELKEQYRDLVQVWHPDRHTHNERLRAKAEEQLKKINDAFAHISDNVDSINSRFGARSNPSSEKSDHDTSKVEKHLSLARVAMSAGNLNDAYSHFNKALGEDPSCSEAWIGKGTTAGLMSTFFEPRLAEMGVCFTQAVDTAAVKDKAQINATKATTSLQVVDLFFPACMNALLETLPTAGVDSNGIAPVWAHYLTICDQMLATLDEVLTILPNEPAALQLVVAISANNIAGVSYTDLTTVQFNDYVKRAMIVTPALKQHLRKKMAVCSEKLRVVDPSFITPNPTEASPGCFVATCVCGSEDHPTVQVLRQFRDQKLRLFSSGRWFIGFYEQHGPKLAALIEPWPTVKKLVLLAVITPASKFARTVLKDSK
jgi:tetratricopeptide (TPR) repeat protein